MSILSRIRNLFRRPRYQYKNVRLVFEPTGKAGTFACDICGRYRWATSFNLKRSKKSCAVKSVYLCDKCVRRFQ